jgi:U3 small nucleolar RNA-associated protein 15
MGRHGKPVEDVIVGQSGTMAVSAGGPIMRVWDLLGASTSRSGLGGDEVEEEVDTGTQYCLKALSNHQKTITSLCWAEGETGEARVLSAGLDGMVKVYDPQENWRVRHTMRYGGQVLSLAVSVRLLGSPCFLYR